MTRKPVTFLMVALAGLVACGGGGGDDGGVPPVQYALTVSPPTNGTIALSPSGGTYTAGTVVTVTATPASGYTFSAWTGALSGTTNPATVTMNADKTVGATFTAVVVDECGLAANTAEVARLTAAQPVLGVRSKAVRTFTTTFASLGGDPAVQCPVTLQFKDLNGDAALQPYEDWTRTAEVRAADLVPRLTAAERQALLLHPALADSPTAVNPAVSAATQAFVTAGVRFGLTTATAAQLTPRATWANNLQAAAEATALGVPFVLSSEPAHGTYSNPDGVVVRAKARGFSQWPNELSLAAVKTATGADDLALIETFGRIASQEFRAIGVRMLLGPSADLATEPRWSLSQFTFGEDGAAVANRVEAFLKGAQGATLGRTSLACVVNGFPGAGPARDGVDARLSKGRLVGWSGTAIDTHLAPFARAFTAGVAGVMPAYGVPATGTWSGLAGALDGATIEQVGASFNAELLTETLRGHYAFSGLVLAPWGVLEDAGIAPLGAPWGVEGLTRAQRLAKAVGAGVDQFGGLSDAALVASAVSGGGLAAAQVDAAAGRALALAFRLGLFEDPYVDPALAPAVVNSDAAYTGGLDAMNRGMVLLLNADKPVGWLNGAGDGTQTGDKGNAGNGTLKVLPAPPGEPYVSAGCDYFVAGDFDLDYVRSVSAGYGNLTNDAPNVKGVPVSTAAERMALSDYVFVRIAAPFTSDPDSGSYDYSLQALEYGPSANASALQPVAAARSAITAWAGTPASRTQIIVGVDAGRPSVVSEILGYGPSGLYVQWSGQMPANVSADKVFLDVAFGIVPGLGKLPVGLPLSDAAAAAQASDLPGDGQHATFVSGFGISTTSF